MENYLNALTNCVYYYFTINPTMPNKKVRVIFGKLQYPILYFFE